MYLVRCVFYGGATREKKILNFFLLNTSWHLLSLRFSLSRDEGSTTTDSFFDELRRVKKFNLSRIAERRTKNVIEKKIRRRHLKYFWVFPPVPQSVSGRVNIAKYICVSGENEKFIYNTIWERGMRGNEKKMFNKNWIVLSSYHRCLLNHVESITTCWEVGNAI